MIACARPAARLKNRSMVGFAGMRLRAANRRSRWPRFLAYVTAPRASRSSQREQRDLLPALAADRRSRWPRFLAYVTAPLALVALLLLLVGNAHAGQLERALMPGAVIKGHQKYEADCELCHSSFDKEQQPQLCLDCHKDVAADVAGNRGFHGRQPETRCKQCHSDHLGVDASIVKLDEASFDHLQADFVLTGKHVGANCEGCHAAGKKHREASSECVDCHRKDDRHETRLGNQCGECHVADAWTTVEKFDHARTEFKLIGAHDKVECKQCHVESPVVKRLAQDCLSCHQEDDPHRGSMGTDCAECHVESDWKTARFDHARTGYVLLGKHRDAECGGCHKVKGEYKNAPSTCIGCHRADDQHRGTLSERCDSCHDSARWKPAPKFDHAHTEFPLLGGHLKAACSGCHVDAAHFADRSKACVDCHRKDDSHKGRNGPKCGDCHDARDWKTSLFDHDKATKFALLGAHRKTTCESCHSGPIETFKPGSTCVDCHAKDDVHKTRLGSDCKSCHAEQDWKDTTYQHDQGRFPLIGGHRLIECQDCHRTQLFADADRECASCHLKDDPHAGRYGVQCARCHSARDWKTWDFNHATTAFALSGAHQRLQCLSCHRVDAGKQLSGECSSCHSKDDVHDGGFGRQCARCHTTSSFTEVAPRVTGNKP